MVCKKHWWAKDAVDQWQNACPVCTRPQGLNSQHEKNKEEQRNQEKIICIIATVTEFLTKSK